jgi:hypothetical protein
MARIFDSLVRLLPGEQRYALEELWANAGSAALPDLLAGLTDRNTVLVLDDLDDLQDAETGRFDSKELVSFLTAICSHRRPPLIVTTSRLPIGVRPSIGAHIARIEISEGLTAHHGTDLLRRFDADCEAGLRDLSDEQLRGAVDQVYGMPRGLELLVDYWSSRQTATLQAILSSRDAPEILLERLVSEGFQRLDAVGRDITRPVTAAALFG